MGLCGDDFFVLDIIEVGPADSVIFFDDIDGHHMFEDRDIGPFFGPIGQSFAHRFARGIVRMDDAAMAMTAFTVQVEGLLFIILIVFGKRYA